MSDSRKCWHCGGILRRNAKNTAWECVEHGCDLVTAKPVGTSYYTPIMHSEQHGMGGGIRKAPTTGLNNR